MSTIESIQQFFTCSPLPAVLADSAGTFLWNNESWESMVTSHDNQLEEKPTTIWKSALSAGLRNFLEGETLFEESISIQARERTLNLTFSGHPLTGDEEQSFWFVVVQDITQSVKNQNRLSLLEKVIDVAQDVILIAEAEPINEINGGPRVVEVNPAFERMTGYKAEEIIGKTPRIFQGPKTDRKELDIIRKALENWEPVEVELTNYRKDGSEFHVHLMISPISDETGWVTHWVAVQRDVTQKKNHLKELEELARRYKAATEAGKVGTWDYNAIDNHLEWDDQMFEVFGVSPDQFSSDFEAWASAVHPEDIEQAEQDFFDALAGKHEFDSVFRIIKNGEVRYIQGKALVSRDEEGKAYLATGINFDITEQKSHREELEILARRYKAATQAGRIGTWEFNVADNHLIWDEQMREIYGVSEDQFSSDYEAWASSVHPDDLEAAQAELGMALEGKKEFETIFRIVRQGEIRQIIGKAIVSRHEDGTPYQVTGINIDITEQRKIEEENSLLKSVAANGKDAVIITEAEPIDKEKGGPKILYVNPSFCEMTGYSPEEIIGKTHRVMQGPKTDPATLKLIRESLEKWEPIEVELINYKKNGEEYWANISLTPIADETGWFTHWVSIERDVTARKLEELALIEAKEIAENASRSKSEFLSTMSHEIRTPLNAVIGMAGLLEETDLDKEQASFVRTIKQGGDTLLSVINDVLDYSKIEAGKVELEEETFALTQPIEDTLELLAGKAYHKGIELMYALGMNLPDMVNGDITRLRQILVNLVGNAIKFTEGGEILVSVKQQRIANEWITLKFSVKDTGVGIPKEKIQGLFDAFSQVDASTTRKFGGTGLGLAICKRLVKLQGGDIWAESKLGEGTTFHFTVMVKQSQAPSINKIGKPQLTGKTIILLDDNFTNLGIMERQLQPSGARIISFSCPEKFLEWANKAKRPDLLIVDYHMPKMTGLQVVNKFVKLSGKKNVPRILLYSAVDISSKELKDKFDVIIQKPCRKSIALEAIESLLKPAITVGKSDKTKSKKPVVDLSGKHILLTEDNLTNQKVAKKMLEKTNALVTVANNGQEAIDALNIRAFDLILMDVQMPVMDGLEATRQIRLLPLPYRTPIIALTANASKADRENCLEAGMDDFLTKPLRKETLYVALEHHLLLSKKVALGSPEEDR